MNVRFLIYLPPKTRRVLSKVVKMKIMTSIRAHTGRLLAMVRVTLKQQSFQYGSSAMWQPWEGPKLSLTSVTPSWGGGKGKPFIQAWRSHTLPL